VLSDGDGGGPAAVAAAVLPDEDVHALRGALAALGAGAATALGVALLVRFVAATMLLLLLAAAPAGAAAAAAALLTNGELVLGWALLGCAALLAATALALAGPVRAAGHVASVGARLCTLGPGVALLGVAATAARVGIGAAALYAAARVAAPAVTVEPAPGAALRRTYALEDETVAAEAAAVLAAGLWLAVFAGHAVHGACAQFALPRLRRADREEPSAATALCRALRRGGGTLALGSLVVTVAWLALGTARYVHRRARDLPGARATAPAFCCRCCATAAAVLARMVVPLAYAAAAAYECGFGRGARRAAALASRHPVLFAMVTTSAAMVAALQGVAAVGAGAVAVRVATGDGRIGPLLLGAACGRVGALAVVSPLQGCINASLVADAIAREGDEYDTLYVLEPPAKPGGEAADEAPAKAGAVEAPAKPGGAAADEASAAAP